MSDKPWRKHPSQMLCNPHLKGVSPALAKRGFFVDWCSRCQEKKAAGLVTGNEPPPPLLRQIKPWNTRGWRAAQ